MSNTANNMNAEKIFNLCLLFDTETSALFESYSRYLARSLTSDFTLGPESLAHLTIVQFEADEQTAKNAFDKLRMNTVSNNEVSLVGITLIPTKENYVWIEINALKTENLFSLHKKAIDVVAGSKIHSGIGDSYRPHVTVARLVDSHAMPQFNLDEKTLRRKHVPCRLALGLSGANFQLAKVVQS